jgi:3-hydroxyacyl-[acyl-carrier-protein] dehydratase
MRIEYFQLIDRIISLNLADQTIRTEAIVPTTSTIFEGHFPGYPLMPGVLLIESMAQTAGWLVVAQRKFEAMPSSCAPSSNPAKRWNLPGSLRMTARVLR